MPNTATINIKTDQGFHTVFLQQDASVPRTIHSLLDNVPHALTGCSASSDGMTFKGDTSILIFTDEVSVTVDPTTNTVALSVSGADITYSGILAADQAAALVAFVKACKLPDLAA